jgi:hypothetical protein
MAVQAIWNNERLGDPAYLGLTLGGTIEYTASGSFVKADYPGLRAIRQDNDEPILAVDLPASHPITPATTTGTPGTPPGGTLGYAQVTANQTGISSATDLTGLAVTVTVATSRRIKITGHHQIVATVAGLAFGEVRESTTTLGRYDGANIAVNSRDTYDGSIIVSPSTGSHTYKLTLVPASGTFSLEAAATIPAFILVEDITLATAAGGGSTGSVLELWY